MGVVRHDMMMRLLTQGQDNMSFRPIANKPQQSNHPNNSSWTKSSPALQFF